MTNEPAKRGRPKKDRRQASFDDSIIEDMDLEDLLEEIDKGEAIAIRVRQAKHTRGRTESNTPTIRKDFERRRTVG